MDVMMKYCTQLCEELSRYPLDIAQSLHSKGFEDIDVENLRTLPDKRGKGNALYIAAIESVEADPNKYPVFISVLLNTHLKFCAEAVNTKIENSIKIIEKVISMAKKLETHSQELERISSALQSRKIQLGLVGLTNAGKSTTANSFIGGSRFLPSSLQRQTVNSIRIVHDPKYKKGELFSNSDSLLPLASGVEPVRSYIEKLNTKTLDSQCRTQSDHDDICNSHIQYSELVLRADVAILSQIEEKFEILDMPSVSEKFTSQQTATTLKSLTAIVLVVSADDVSKGTLTDLVDYLKRIHPGLIEKQSRVIVLINKYDLCYDGNKSSWTPDKLQEEMAKHIGVPIEQTVCFSATYAQEAQEWMRNPSAVTKDMYHKKYYDLRQTPEKDSIDSLKEYTPENVKELAKALETFSQFKEVEMKLLLTLCVNGPEILLDSSIDDCCGVVSKMEEAITHRIKEIDVQGKENKVEQQKAQAKKVKQFFRSETFFPEAVLQSSEIQLNALVSALQHDITTQAFYKVVHLKREYENEEQASDRVLAIRNSMLNLGEDEIRKCCDWNAVIAQMKDILSTNLKLFLQELNQKVVSEQLNDLLEINVDQSKLLETRSFPLVEKPDFAQCAAVSDDAVKLVIQPLARIRQKNVEKSINSSSTMYSSGRTCYLEAVDHRVTVFEVNIDSLLGAFHQFALFCSNHVRNYLQKNLKDAASELSQALWCELQQLSEKLIQHKENEFKAEKNLQESKKEVEELNTAYIELEQARIKLCDSPSLSSKKRELEEDNDDGLPAPTNRPKRPK